MFSGARLKKGSSPPVTPENSSRPIEYTSAAAVAVPFQKSSGAMYSSSSVDQSPGSWSALGPRAAPPSPRLMLPGCMFP